MFLKEHSNNFGNCYISKYINRIKFTEKTLRKINLFKRPKCVSEHMLENVSEKH